MTETRWIRGHEVVSDGAPILGVGEPGPPWVEDSPRGFLRVRVVPSDWHPLEMALVVRPLPGFPDNYAIACRQSEDDPIPDTSSLAYGYGPTPTRFGEWEQPITRELFARIMRILENARIPLVASGGCIVMIDGPPITAYTLELGGASFAWLGPGGEAGWEPLAEVAQMMLDAVQAARPVALPVSYFKRRDL